MSASFLTRLKRITGIDTRRDKYTYAKDPIFGHISESRVAERWLPNLLGQSKQHTGSYRSGLLLYVVLAVAVLVVMRIAARSWARTWVGAGGRANEALSAFHSEMAPNETSVMEIAT
jgi:hypothetical protein